MSDATAGPAAAVAAASPTRVHSKNMNDVAAPLMATATAHPTMVTASSRVRLIRSVSTPMGSVSTAETSETTVSRTPIGVADVEGLLEVARRRRDGAFVGAVERDDGGQRQNRAQPRAAAGSVGGGPHRLRRGVAHGRQGAREIDVHSWRPPSFQLSAFRDRSPSPQIRKRRPNSPTRWT